MSSASSTAPASISATASLSPPPSLPISTNGVALQPRNNSASATANPAIEPAPAADSLPPPSAPSSSSPAAVTPLQQPVANGNSSASGAAGGSGPPAVGSGEVQLQVQGNPWQRRAIRSRPLVLRILQVIVLSVFVPFRILLLVGFVIVLWLVAFFAVLGAKPPLTPDDPPLAPWRTAVMRGFIRRWARGFLFLLGFWHIRLYTVQPKLPPADAASETLHQPFNELSESLTYRPTSLEAVRKEFDSRKSAGTTAATANVLVANHIGYCEILLALSLYGCSFVGKYEISRYPLIRSIAFAMQCIFVKRTDASDKDRVKRMLINRANNTNFPPVCIFSEGTTTNGLQCLQFQKGIFETAANIQPLGFRCQYKFFYPGWTQENILRHMWRSLFSGPHTLVAMIPQVYHPSEAEKNDALVYAQNLQGFMCRMLGIVVARQNMYDAPHLKDRKRKKAQTEGKGEKAKEKEKEEEKKDSGEKDKVKEEEKENEKDRSQLQEQPPSNWSMQEHVVDANEEVDTGAAAAAATN